MCPRLQLLLEYHRSVVSFTAYEKPVLSSVTAAGMQVDEEL